MFAKRSNRPPSQTQFCCFVPQPSKLTLDRSSTRVESCVIEHSTEFSQGIPITETPVLSNAILIHYENLKNVIVFKSSHFLVTVGWANLMEELPPEPYLRRFYLGFTIHNPGSSSLKWKGYIREVYCN